MFISEIINNTEFTFTGKCRILESDANGAKREIWSNAESGDISPDLLMLFESTVISAVNVADDGFLEICYRVKPENEFRAEIEWMYDLTVYEWQPGIVPMSHDDALETLSMWRRDMGDDEIPARFLEPHGYKLLADLWNRFIA